MNRCLAAMLAARLGGCAFLLAEPAEFPVEPLTRYRLSFTAEADAPGARWEVRVAAPDGSLPHEGVFAEPWQQLQAGKHAYRHEFLTPRDGRRLTFRVETPKAEGVTLEKIEGDNLVLNGDFSAGTDNFSGWNTTHLAALKEQDGKRTLACDSAGYAVSDPIPVEPGAACAFIEGTTPGGRLLLCDRGLLTIGVLFENGFAFPRDATFRIPEGVAFLRIEYADGRKGRAPAIARVGLRKVAEGDGKPPGAFGPYPGEIVLPADASAPEIRAARELQHWVRRISGKEIRVLAEPSGAAHPRLFVGRRWAETRFPDDLRALEGSDGFALRKDGRNVYVFGARPAGALFGAIRLLEENSDLIFPRPDGETSAVFSPDPDFTFRHADRLMRPAFAYRMSNPFAAENQAENVWHGRMGLNTSPRNFNLFRRHEMGGAPSFEDNYMDTMARLPEFAFENCSREHPEFFALVDGKRLIRPKGYICYTAPGIAEALAEGVRDVVAEHERRGEPIEFIQVRTRDGWTVCTCDGCREPILLPDGSRLEPKALTSEKDPLFFSTRMAGMLNRVAADLSRTHPRLTLTVPAYLYASVPPAIPHGPSLAPMFCAYPTCSIRFPILKGEHNDFNEGRQWEEKFREYLRRAGKGGKLSMFSYHYTNGFAPVADAAREDWLAMVHTGGAYQVHFDGISRDAPREDGVNPWDFDAPEKWIMARLLWEPGRDAGELREEYCRRAYREAAPEMIEFHNRIRKAWRNPAIRLGVNCHTPGSLLFDTFIVQTGQEAELRALLERAEQKATHPVSRQLVGRVRRVFSQLSDSLQRVEVPFVTEATAEWDLPESTFWLQARKFEGFKKVPTWGDFHRAPAARPTAVSVMRDGKHLYVRFDARDAAPRDRVEVVLEAERNTMRYYLALDATGRRASLRNFADWESDAWGGKVAPTPDGYTALFRIPFTVMENLKADSGGFRFMAKFARLANGPDGPDGTEESSLTGHSITRTHYANYWTTFSVGSQP